MSDLSTQLAAALPQDSLPGPRWVQVLRDGGADQFRAFGLPTRKDESWKYTGLGLLDQHDIQLASALENAGSASVHPAPLVETGVQVNIFDGQVQLHGGKLPTGLTVVPLAEALNGEISGLRDLLESLPGSGAESNSAHGFTALNSATLDTGLVVHVAAATDAGRLVLNWSSLAGEVNLLFNTRICIIVEPDAKLELLEQFVSLNGSANARNIVLQVDLGVGSVLQHIRFQQEPEDTVLITNTQVLQQADSEYAHFGFDLGGGLVRHDLHTSLHGSGAKAGINGAYLLDGNRHVDNHTMVDHIAPGGSSDQYYRGVAGGCGRAVFNTRVLVHPGADETEATQSNANILLSARAEVDTKPELEIYADEVIASHGATVGQLDEQAVFYLRSRGLSEKQARQLLTTAFCRSVSDKLADPVLSEVISQRMMDVMPHAE